MGTCPVRALVFNPLPHDCLKRIFGFGLGGTTFAAFCSNRILPLLQQSLRIVATVACFLQRNVRIYPEREYFLSTCVAILQPPVALSIGVYEQIAALLVRAFVRLLTPFQATNRSVCEDC